MTDVSPYDLVESRDIYRNNWITVLEDRVVRQDGGESVFGLVKMKEGVTILPVDSDGETHLVSEYKYGIQRDSIELVSGGIDAGESPLEAAKRELKEELGLEARSWTYLGAVDPFTTVISSTNHMYLARGLSRGETSPDEGEVVTPLAVPFGKALNMTMEGEITHSASCCLILKAAHLLKDWDA